MSDFLQKMALASKERAELLPTAYSAELLDDPVFPLQFDCFDIIAEVKDLSPSEGKLNLDGKNRNTRSSEYIEGGAAAISVLTEPMQFSGNINHLKENVKAAFNGNLSSDVYEEANQRLKNLELNS